MLLRQMQGWLLFLQCNAVPLAQVLGSVVGALRKIQQNFIRLFSGAHGVVWQNELAQLRFVERSIWLDLRFFESLRFRICIRVEKGCRHGSIARPKTQAAYLLRISLTRNCIRQMWNPARVRRRGPTGKTCHREIKAAPEKMHRTALATEP